MYFNLLRRKIILSKNRNRTNSLELPGDVLKCDSAESPEYKARRKSKTTGLCIQPQTMNEILTSKKNENTNLFPSNENIFSQLDSQNNDKTSQKVQGKIIFLARPITLFWNLWEYLY